MNQTTEKKGIHQTIYEVRLRMYTQPALHAHTLHRFEVPYWQVTIRVRTYGHGSKSSTPSEHPNPHKNRLKWVVHLPQIVPLVLTHSHMPVKGFPHCCARFPISSIYSTLALSLSRLKRSASAKVSAGLPRCSAGQAQRHAVLKLRYESLCSKMAFTYFQGKAGCVYIYTYLAAKIVGCQKAKQKGANLWWGTFKHHTSHMFSAHTLQQAAPSL